LNKNIAFLILCHTDASRVRRLARRMAGLGTDCRVFVHVDAKSPERADIEQALDGIAGVQRVDPLPVWWGGFSAVQATCRLMEAARRAGPFRRYVLLQGADYPIKADAQIRAFFASHASTEFIRAGNVSKATSLEAYSKARYVLFYDRPDLLKKVWNKLTRVLDIKARAPHLRVGGESWDFFWGCAQWALTDACVQHLLERSADPDLQALFRRVFPADEVYFHTLVFNSGFAALTTRQAPESAQGRTLTDFLNLVYFEYPDRVRVFDHTALALLLGRPELFARKMNTAQSTVLLDALDALHAGGATVPAHPGAGEAEPSASTA
jgi:hypothetical protein